MRGKIWSTIEEICLGVIDDQAAGASGAVVDLDSPNGALIEWHTTINPDFETYLKYLGEGEGTAVFDNTRFMMLMNCTEHGRQGWIQKISKTIPLDSLIRYDQLGGRGCTTKVALRDGDAGGLYVFKGVDLRTFLTYIDGESDDAIKYMIKTWHHANKRCCRYASSTKHHEGYHNCCSGERFRTTGDLRLPIPLLRQGRCQHKCLGS